MQIIVLLSIYNVEKYLKTQLDSLLAQTIAPDMKIIVRDDGSHDTTCKIWKSIKNREN